MSQADAGFAIQTHALTKRFGSRLAVDSIDLAVPEGTVFGFLGPNGSGKTTTIRMLLGLVAASSGEARLLGEPIPEHAHSALPSVGALVEGPAFYPFLSGTANLMRLDAADPTASGATRKRRVADALARVGLGHVADRRASAYSLGMKQRLGIAGALLRPRRLLVLDEPTNGLDPQGTREVRALIRGLADDGTTVFVSSHLLAEIEQVCSHAGILSAGRLVAQGTLGELRGPGARSVVVRTPDAEAARAVLARLGLHVERGSAGDAPAAAGPTTAGGATTPAGAVTPAAAGGAAEGEDVVAALGEHGQQPERIVAGLVAAGVRVRGFRVEGTSLEDRFVSLTGEGFDVER